MVNSHLKIQQTKATAVLEGLQAAPRHRPGYRPGRPSTAGTLVGKGGAAGGAGNPARGGWGYGHSASQRPERRKTESELGKRGQRPSARAPRKRAGGGRSGDSGSAHPPSRVGFLPDPRPTGLPPTHTARVSLTSGPCHRPSDLFTFPDRPHSCFHLRGSKNSSLAPSLTFSGKPVFPDLERPQPHCHLHPPAERLPPSPPPPRSGQAQQEERQTDVAFPVPSFLASTFCKVLSV